MLYKRLLKIALCLLLVPVFCTLTFTNRLNESIHRSTQEQLEVAVSAEKLAPAYDVIVAGTDPEGVMAAISAARNGLKVLLVDNRNRSILGGLMTLGWLNSLDLNKAPVSYRFWNKPIYLNKGLFQEWYEGIQGTSFDVNHAANLFHRMVADEPNIDLLLKARQMDPVMVGNQAVGMRIVKEDGSVEEIMSKAIIDATQDADIAVAAGAEYTVGRGDIGEPNAQMAVTLVFKLSGVTDEVWHKLKTHKNTGFDSRSIWGYPEAREYESSDPKRVKMRSLNLGRQDGDTLLINSMQIYGVNPLDPESVQEGLRIGQKEAPLIVDFLKKRFKEFRDLEYAGTAPELYVRETRHIKGEYRLSMVDLMENRDHWDAIAYGAYEVDIQSSDASNKGSIMLVPEQYGVPFRCLVPLHVEGMLVVGRSASFDSLPHGSARVIPLGMATGEASGAAVKLAIDEGLTLRELSKSEAGITKLRQRLKKQGMDLRMRSFPTPEYAKHKDYQGLLVAASHFLTIGGYSNDGWALDKAASPKRFANSVRTLQKRYPDLLSEPLSAADISEESAKEPLSLAHAADLLARALIESESGAQGASLQTLIERGWIVEDTLANIANRDKLTNGDTFMLYRDILQKVGMTFK
ncbi:FAD-dependent oxidoreductase [Cohnella cholangitidis]|uniref:FAD-dependent oxidoreductase n=1 Tax=Cohnella cholangitidis TaxID=2598458 RepID=A0A7G5C059_9BACL|nr:FAD-dependent oxidoreductase [Cohnella cholangitidis]QMV42593.1 FAD-dependent oxidoreductase [Cohnella cholangitidis]